jgi:hypothetical protein
VAVGKRAGYARTRDDLGTGIRFRCVSYFTSNTGTTRVSGNAQLIYYVLLSQSPKRMLCCLQPTSVSRVIFYEKRDAAGDYQHMFPTLVAAKRYSSANVTLAICGRSWLFVSECDTSLDLERCESHSAASRRYLLTCVACPVARTHGQVVKTYTPAVDGLPERMARLSKHTHLQLSGGESARR